MTKPEGAPSVFVIMVSSFGGSARLLVAVALALSAGGCQALGILASKQPPPLVPASYDKLAGQPTAVWVWVDQAVDLDHPSLSLQIGTQLQRQLEQARDGGSRRQKAELRGTSFPIEPRSIVRYQKRDPMLNAMPITQIAPRLAEVNRIVYVEVRDFTTQGGAAAGLFRGVATINIAAIETDHATQTARIAYEEQDVKVVFPPTGPSAGSSSYPPQAVYQGLVLRISDQAARRFVSLPAEED